jgi:hypothetical protein
LETAVRIFTSGISFGWAPTRAGHQDNATHAKATNSLLIMLRRIRFDIIALPPLQGLILTAVNIALGD